MPGAVDKGKGREVPLPSSGMSVGAPTPGVDGGDGDDGEEEGPKSDKKQKNTYRHLIKGIPGMCPCLQFNSERLMNNVSFS